MIVLVIAIDAPHPKQIDKRANIQSYLYTRPAALKPKVKEPESVKPVLANSHPPVEEPNAIEQTATIPNQPLPATSPIEIVNDQPGQNTQMKHSSQQNKATAGLNETSTIKSDTANFITALNSKKLNELSQQSAQAYRQPEQLIDKSKIQSKNAQLKAQSADFAPPGSGIIVLSEFGPNETTIMVDDSCMTVTKTDLLDPVDRGVSIWRLGGAGCKKYDKFNGQLQKSLDKYLKH